jgi:hypothetical protein
MSDTANTPKMTQKRPATLRGRFQAAMAALSPRISAGSTMWDDTARQFAGRHGKHNGRTKGAFGNPKSPC